MKKIGIIKLGAKGDVIRTLPIAKALKEKHRDSIIYWITKSNISDLISGSPYIDKLFTLPYYTDEEFDLLYNFDTEDEATDLAQKLIAKKKYGFGNVDNFVSAFNLGAEYYLNTMFDDDLKKSNKKTYQEMMFEAAELEYNKEHAQILLNNNDFNYANNFITTNNIPTENLIGIHTGASPRWPSKVWHKDNLKEFISKAKQKGYNSLLFAGPDESERQDKIINELKERGIQVFRNDSGNTDRQFASLLSKCKSLVCSDSFSMHVSLALKKPTVGLFFCTSHNEVEDYSLLKKLTSPMLYEFFPEKMDSYNEELTKSIKSDEVLSAIDEIFKREF